MKLIRRYILVILFFSLSFPCSAQEGALLNTPYKPHFSKGSIQSFLDDIEAQTHVNVSFSNATLDVRRRLRLSGAERTIGEALQTILAGENVTPIERSGKILIIAGGHVNPIPRSYTINGYVKDSTTKEVLIGATIYVPALNAGTVTNTYGFYSLSLPEGSYSAVGGYIGYTSDTFGVPLHTDIRKDLLLSSGAALQEIKVTSTRQSSPDHAHLTISDIKSNAALLGETDIMRALQHLTGVQSGIDGMTGLYVRGGDPGQNLNLLDGVPLYNIDHFFGITSIFNTDAIKSVDFYKGAFPARYGGRLSSITDVSTRDGDMERVGGQLNVGLVKGSLNLEGPVIKDKAAIMIAARRTWVDLLWRPFTNALSIDFYDINTKANYIINANNRLYISFYNGRDQIGADIDDNNIKLKWGNTLAAARWTTIITPKVFINTTATYGLFRYQLTNHLTSTSLDSALNTENYTGTSRIREAALRTQLHWYLTPKYHIEAGLLYSYSTFDPATVDYANSPTASIAAPRFFSNEAAAYAEVEIKLGKKILVRPGLHLDNWFNRDYQYSSLQPRFYLAYRPAEGHMLYTSFTQMGQFLHLLTSNTTGLPSDFWIPSTARLSPEKSLMGTVGYTIKCVGDLNINAELYYKQITGLVSYKGGKNIFDNTTHWEDKLTQGKGWGYGWELSAQKKFGSLTASLAYTLSWTWRQFEALNGGDAFPYRYDRRHNLKADLRYDRSKRFNAIVGWTYMSGEAITLPDQVYPDFDNNLLNTPNNVDWTYNYTSWNNYRLPAIHRLDIAANFCRYKGKHTERIWTLGIFNAYGHKNLIGVNLNQDQDGTFSLTGISIFMFIPTISYSLKF